MMMCGVFLLIGRGVEAVLGAAAGAGAEAVAVSGADMRGGLYTVGLQWQRHPHRRKKQDYVVHLAALRLIVSSEGRR
jgi:hypothetical protein